MDSRYRDIAELFGLKPADLPEDAEELEPKKRRKARSAEESDELGRESLSEGDYEAAVKHFRRAVELREAGDVSSRVDLAAALEFGDMAPEAWRQYQIAAKLAADDPEPLSGMSGVLKRYGRYREAVEALTRAISLDPEDTSLHSRLAETLREMGERKRALIAGRKAVAAEPTSPYYHFWVGDLLIEMKRYAEALDSLQAAIELSPGDDFLFLRASVAFWADGRQKDAIKAVRLAGDLDPEKNLYHGLLAVLLKETGMAEDAKLEEGRAAKMDRYDRETLRRVLLEMGLH